MLRTHGTMVDISAPFVMPMCDSDIPMNVPFTSRNKQPFPHAKEATKRFAALSEHQHASERLVMQCTHSCACDLIMLACLLGKRPAQCTSRV